MNRTIILKILIDTFDLNVEKIAKAAISLKITNKDIITSIFKYFNCLTNIRILIELTRI